MSFRLMQCVGGDEWVIEEFATYEEAAAFLEVKAHQLRSDLSIWEVGGRIVGVIDPKTGTLNRVPTRKTLKDRS